jgi:hypothetical protein
VNLESQAALPALDSYFLEARSKLLDLAGILDRIDRGGKMESDPRMARIHNAILILSENHIENRAEFVQTIFSLPYDPNWKRPTPGTSR